MKKSILAVAVMLASTATFAQEKNYLPEADDWAIGVDATPFLNYVGNLIGGNDGNVAPTWNFLTTNQTITGKYFAAEDMAYRGSLRLGFGSMKGGAAIVQDGSTAPTYPNLPTTVEDSWKMGMTNIGLSGGIEYRKGKGRLQGFYGGELGVAVSSSKSAYTYGNPMTTTGASTTNFGTNITTDPVYGVPGRITESKSGSSIGFGLRGFIGAEYFVLPKLAVGGEFGWGLVFASTGASSTTIESTDGTSIASITHEGSKSSSFGVDTDNVNSVFGPAGSLRMTFHF